MEGSMLATREVEVLDPSGELLFGDKADGVRLIESPSNGLSSQEAMVFLSPVSLSASSLSLEAEQQARLFKDYQLEVFNLKQLLAAAQQQLSEQKALQQQMQVIHQFELEKLQQQMHEQQQGFSAVLHEVRNPLHTQMLLTESLLHTIAVANPQLKMGSAEAALTDFVDSVSSSLEKIHYSSQVQRNILDQNLEWQKLGQKQIILEKVIFNPAQVIAKVVEMLTIQATSKGLQLIVDVTSCQNLYITGDAYRTQQIAANLIGNAIKFTTSGSVTVTLSLAVPNTTFAPVDGALVDQEHVVLTVTDTGIGISAEEQANLFREFSQANPSISRRFKGTGLGLSIANKLADMMKGHISVVSEVGRGSTFTCKLTYQQLNPAEKLQLDAYMSTQMVSEQVKLPRKLRFLIADDNTVNRKLLVKILTDDGHYCDEAENGLEVIEKWEVVAKDPKGQPYDAILTDVGMPQMTGTDAVKRIRSIEMIQQAASASARAACETKDQNPLASPTIIIAVTGGALSQDKQECYEAGMNEVVAKPFSKAELYRVLARLLTTKPTISIQPSCFPKQAVAHDKTLPKIYTVTAGSSITYFDKLHGEHARQDAIVIDSATRKSDESAVAILQTSV